ncbi:MAG: hypothetical protein JWM95_2489 [Gemmatimonadetes bacterium]|nr:hypothetical protein [Gemmatimonadota bacterium]
MKKRFSLDASTDTVLGDVQREIDLHLDLRASEFEALGMKPDEARRAALAAFGDRGEVESEVAVVRTKTIRERRRRDWLAELRQDAVIGIRGLMRAPAFTIVALLTLGIGIGANTAIFSVIRSVLLRPLPYTHPEQLVQVWTDHRAKGRPEPEWLTPPDFIEWRDGNRSFSHLAAYQGWGPDITSGGDPEALTGAAVSGTMLAMLDVKPVLGRLLNASDDDPGMEQVVVLSHGLWQRRFGSDSTIIGKPLTLSGTSWTVVGVLPASFRAPMSFAPELYRALRRPVNETCGRGCYILQVIGRLKAGTTLAMAHADLTRIATQQAIDFPATNAKIGVWLVPLHEQLTGKSRSALLALSGAVAFVLLIGCVNLANLLLVRGAARTRELGVRAALGAGRGRMIRQLLTENLILAFLGGVLGIALGFAGSRVMAAMVPESIRLVQDIRMDGQVLLFAAGVTLLGMALFGVLPALQAVRPNLMGALRSGTRQTERRGGALRSGLVVAQLSLAVVLLVGAGLLLRSFVELQRVDLGYRTSGISFAGVGFPRARYADVARVSLALEDLLARLRNTPAIRSVEITDVPPLSGGDQDISVFPLGEAQRADLPPSIWARSVTPGYIRQMGVRLVAGRQLSDEDRRGGVRVALINEEAARRYFPGTSAVGRILATGTDSASPQYTIVGVVASVRHNGPNQPYRVEIFRPIAQTSARGIVLVIESAQSEAATRTALRQVLHDVDPLLPVPELEPIDRRLGEAVALPRLYTMLVAGFAIAALLLAVLGVYGVMAYSVSQRQREIGVRLALGAAPSNILGMVLGHGGRLAALGLGVGLVAALMLGQLIRTMLFGVTVFDAPTFIVVPVILGTMALVASWLPARRAMRVDPLVAIRAD